MRMGGSKKIKGVQMNIETATLHLFTIDNYGYEYSATRADNVSFCQRLLETLKKSATSQRQKPSLHPLF